MCSYPTRGPRHPRRGWVATVFFQPNTNGLSAGNHDKYFLLNKTEYQRMTIPKHCPLGLKSYDLREFYLVEGSQLEHHRGSQPELCSVFCIVRSVWQTAWCLSDQGDSFSIPQARPTPTLT